MMVSPGIMIAVALWRFWRRNHRTRTSTRALQTARRRIPARTRASRIGGSSRWSMSCSDAAFLWDAASVAQFLHFVLQ